MQYKWRNGSIKKWRNYVEDLLRHQKKLFLIQAIVMYSSIKRALLNLDAVLKWRMKVSIVINISRCPIKHIKWTKMYSCGSLGINYTFHSQTYRRSEKWKDVFSIHISFLKKMYYYQLCYSLDGVVSENDLLCEEKLFIFNIFFFRLEL